MVWCGASAAAMLLRLQEATKFARHSKRVTLTASDISCALRLRNIEVRCAQESYVCMYPACLLACLLPDLPAGRPTRC